MKRRLLILQPNLTPLYPDAERRMMNGEAPAELGAAAEIDLSGIPNADARAPFIAVIQEFCDHEQWHQVGPQLFLPNWDER